MNIGIYIDSISNLKNLTGIDNFINKGLLSRTIKDASIFYDDVGFSNLNIKCGMFNSTDLWNFKGTLIVTSLQCLVKVHKIVNNINLLYYYGWEEKGPLFATIATLDLPNKIICKSADDATYLNRISGKSFKEISENFEELRGLL
jgi:hypothetical protein